MMNEFPRVDSASGAFANRFLILPMTRTWEGKEDEGLADRLLTELPGILNWSLDGLARLRERGRFVQPQSGRDALRDLEHLGSRVKQFLDEECDVGPVHSEPANGLYKRFVKWCNAEGIPAPDSQIFGRELNAAIPGLKKSRPGSRGLQAWCYTGIGPKAHPPAEDLGDNVIDIASPRRQRAHQAAADHSGCQHQFGLRVRGAGPRRCLHCGEPEAVQHKEVSM